jgi:Flp pilus assembly protein TadD
MIMRAFVLTVTGLSLAVLSSSRVSQLPLHQTAAYVDDASRAGLQFQFRNSPTSTKYLIEAMGGGIAIFDYDHDGWQDIFLVNGARLRDGQRDGEAPDKSAPEFWNRLFRNNHDGTFSDVTERAGLRGSGYGMGVATGDYDNDGFTDLLVTNYGGAVLYRNNGNGTFSDVSAIAGIRTSGWTTGAAFLDYNNDGFLDLFVTRYLDWNFAIGGIFCGDQRPGGRAYCHPDEFKPVSSYLFRNNCNGRFTDVSEASHVAASKGKGLGIALGDFDNDGLVDVYVANDSYPQFLFRNHGDGTFAETGTRAGIAYNEDGHAFSGMGVAVADIDNDALPDIITTALPYEYYAFFHARPGGMFNYGSVTSDLAQKVAIAKNPNHSGARYELGRLLFADEQFDEAAAQFEKAAELQPNRADIYLALGKVYRQQGKDAQAEQAFNTALLRNADLSPALYELAVLYKKRGDKDRATAYFNKVRALHQQEGSTGEAEAANSEGMRLMNQGELDKALAAFRHALEVDPAYVVSAYNMGVVLAHQGNQDAAIAVFRKAVEIRPTYAPAHLGLGLLLQLRHDPNSEVELRTAAMLKSLNTPDPKAAPVLF